MSDIKRKEYVIFDDFVTKFFNGLVIKNIKLNNKVCLIDPRLCDIDIFNRYLNELLKYVELDKIKIIAFENDKETCLINIVKRINASAHRIIPRSPFSITGFVASISLL